MFIVMKTITIVQNALDMLFVNLLKMRNFLNKILHIFYKPKDTFPEETINYVEDSVVHNWQLVGKTYTPPLRNIPTQLTDVTLLEKAMFGVTTLLFQDTVTGTLRKETLAGSDENQLFDLFDKAERFGIQYIPYNGRRFAVALVPNEEVVPLKEEPSL